MRIGRRLDSAFYRRSADLVAPELVGCLLVRDLEDGSRLTARLVEVEAYLGDGTDPSAHSHRGPTPRNRSMFGPAGHLYAYLSYGIHTCVNVVCEPAGVASAVLLRAAEPLEGEDRMRAHRALARGAPGRQVASGPGRLAQAFGLSLDHDGIPIAGRGAALRIHRPPAGAPRARVSSGPRIGITKAADLPYRFFEAGNPHVSGPRVRGRRAASASGTT